MDTEKINWQPMTIRKSGLTIPVVKVTIKPLPGIDLNSINWQPMRKV